MSDPSANAGLVGVLFVLIFREVRAFINERNGNAPREMRSRVGQALEALRGDVAETKNRVAALYEWHNKTDAKGTKLMYRGDIDEKLDRIEAVLEEIRRGR